MGTNSTIDYASVGGFCFSKKGRRFSSARYRTTYGVLELYRNSELIHPFCDNRTLGQLDGRDRIVNPSFPLDLSFHYSSFSRQS